MICSEIKIRVRYSETDKMGYVYHGHYAQYYEVARTEMLRNMGVTYSQMENEGILLPVSSLSVKYYKPALYDDLLTVKVRLVRKPLIKLEFEYQIFNEADDLLNEGSTVLVFVNAETRKPRQAPEYFLDFIASKFQL